MELKFRVKDFKEIKKMIRQLKAKLIDSRTELYNYLDSENKLQVTKGKYYRVSIKKKRNLFQLTYKMIDKDTYNKTLKKSGVIKTLRNKRHIYRVDSVDVSLNSMKIGKFVISDGKKNDVARGNVSVWNR